jgi:hypothetical protein
MLCFDRHVRDAAAVRRPRQRALRASVAREPPGYSARDINDGDVILWTDTELDLGMLLQEGDARPVR